MACLDADQVVLHLEKKLSTEQSGALLEHIGECEDCRRLLAVFYQSVEESTWEDGLASPLLPEDPADTSVPPPQKKQPGEQVGRYRLLKKIGAGGMGVVFSARDTKMNRDVAIKFVNSGVSYDQLTAEARSMARVQHPNVVAVFEVDTINDQHFVVMELVKGINFRRWLGHEKDWRIRLNTLLQAGHGLAAAHANGVIHRDFKPENMMMEGNRIQVLDFGLARATALDSDLDSTTDTGVRENSEGNLKSTFAGTPPYMAPEKYRSLPSTTFTDQFAFCVALFEAAHNRRPFRGGTVGELRESILSGKVDSESLNSEVPRSVQRVISRGLSRNPAKRFASMDQLLIALEQALNPRTAKHRLRAVMMGIVAAAIAVLALQSARRYWPAKGSATAAPKTVIPNEDLLPELLPQPLPNDPDQVTIHRLSNGITVYIGTNRVTPKIEARLVVRVGIAEEALGASGSAQLLYQMMHQGTTKIGTTDYTSESVHLQRIDELYQRIGSLPIGAERDVLLREVELSELAAAEYVIPNEFLRTANHLGITYESLYSQDTTIFSAHMLSNRLATWAELEAERITNPVFRQFRSEVSSLLSNISMQNHQETALANAARGLSPVGGSPADIAMEPYHATKKLYRDWYHPNNAAIVLAGDIDADRAIPLLEAKFGHWKPKPLPARKPIATKSIAPNTIISVPAPDDSAYLVWNLTDANLMTPSFLYLSLFAGTKQYTAAHTIHHRWPSLIVGVKGLGDSSWAALESLTAATINQRDFTESKIQELRNSLFLDKHSNYLVAGVCAANFLQVTRRTTIQQWEQIKAYSKSDILQLLDTLKTITPVKLRGAPSLQKKITIHRTVTTHKFAEVSSDWAAQLSEAQFSKLSPKFVYEGRDYRVVTQDSSELIQVESETSSIGLSYVDTLSLPLLRIALIAASSTMQSPLVAKRRQANSFLLVLTVPSSVSLASFWKTNIEYLRGDHITEEHWKKTITRYTSFMEGVSSSKQFVQALNAYAVDGRRSRWFSIPSINVVKNTSLAEIQRTLQQFTQIAPKSILYTGNSPAEEFTGLFYSQWGKNIRPPALLKATNADPPAERNIRTWTMQRDSAETIVSVLLPLSNLSHRQYVSAETLERYWRLYLTKPRFDEHEPPVEISVRKFTDEGPTKFLCLSGAVPHQHAAALSEYLLQTVRTVQISSPHLAKVKQQIQDRYRSDWILSKDLAERIHEWRSEGHTADPRPARFGLTSAIGPQDIAQVSTMMSSTMRLTIVGDLKAIDIDAIPKLGTRRRVTSAEIFP